MEYNPYREANSSIATQKKFLPCYGNRRFITVITSAFLLSQYYILNKDSTF